MHAPFKDKTQPTRYSLRWLIAGALVCATIFSVLPLHRPVYADVIQDAKDAGVIDVSVSTGEQPSGEQPSREVELNTATGPQDVRVFGTQIGFFGIDPRVATAGEYVNAIYKFAMATIGFFAVAAIMFGAVGYVLSGGSEEKIKKSKDIILGAVSAVILALLSHAILQTIDPRLVELTSDFGANDVDTPAFVTGKVCKEDKDCEGTKPVFTAEVCGVVGDERKVIQQSTVCDKLPTEAEGRCAIPQDGVERILEKFPSSCADDTQVLPSAFTCKRGLVSRPITDDGQEITGVIGEARIATTFNGGFTLESYQATYLPSGLIEDIRTDAQGEPLYSIGSGYEYLYHKCLPPTENQLKYSRVTDTTTTAGTACATDVDCGTFDRAATICTSDGKKEQKTYPVRQVCEAGLCRVKENSFCGQDPLDLCGGSPIRGTGVLLSVNGVEQRSDPCQSGTICLRGNSDVNQPPTYGCAKAGAENYSATAFWDGTLDKSQVNGLPNFACDQDSDCKNFEQRVWECDGTNAEEDGTEDVELVCDKNINARTPDGKGTCRVKEDSFCRQDAGLCGGKTAIVRAEYPCVTGTSCKYDEDNDDPARNTCQP